MISALTNHLWQSTWFAAAAALLAFALRKSKAEIRFWLWLSASCKFLLPFSLLMSLGGHLAWAPAAREMAAASISQALLSQTSLSHTVTQISQPFSGALALPPAAHSAGEWAIVAMVAWACGVLCIAAVRIRGWRHVRAAIRASVLMDFALPVKVRSCPGLVEPGVIGLFRPFLLLPADIMQRLTKPQLDAVLAHELCHIRRRDNLIAAVHMVVEAVFWFYPLVWWIGARLMQERERACDEEVLRLGNSPQEYAEGILNVCKSYAPSPLPCVTGVNGSDLKTRVRAILAGGVADELSRSKRMALAVAGIGALSAPVVIGLMGGSSIRAQSQQPSARSSAASASSASQAGAAPALQSAGAKAGPEPTYLQALGTVAAYSVTVRPQIEGQLRTVTFKEGDLVQTGQLLGSIDSQVYELQVAEAESQLSSAQTQFAEAEQAVKARLRDPAVIAPLKSAVEITRTNLERAKLQMSYTQIRAPITGIIGLRRVDPGNMVRPDDPNGLAVVNQIEPISVVFDLPEDRLPQALALLRKGANLPVEVWNREATVRLAAGRLVAVDNQIDPTTGTVKLKATFDNKDGALFPNQFVNVRLTLKTQ